MLLLTLDPHMSDTHVRVVRLTHARAAGQQTFSPHVLLTELVKQHPKGIKKNNSITSLLFS